MKDEGMAEHKEQWAEKTPQGGELDDRVAERDRSKEDLGVDWGGKK